MRRPSGFDARLLARIRADHPRQRRCISATIPAQKFAVFTHRDHLSAIRRTWFSIWNKGLPDAALEATGGPEFERYDERFDGRSGLGEVEIWIPVKR